MNRLVKVFSNFREFYSEINGATLTGAIDVIVVDQPDGTFLCSPFHVRFGKLGVLRSREKIVDIEVNGEPVDIHMKLGDSGEAFFVEECAEDDLEQLPANMATSPLPTSEFSKYTDSTMYAPGNEEDIDLPKPRRNSIDFSNETVEPPLKKFENQISDFSHRRHTDNTLERRNLGTVKKEFTTQKIRQEWAEHEESLCNTVTTPSLDAAEGDDTTSTTFRPIENAKDESAVIIASSQMGPDAAGKDETKSKKKRRKKSMMKKKATQRKSSSSSSVGSAQSDQNDPETDTISLSNDTRSSNEDSPKSEHVDATLIAKAIESAANTPSKSETRRVRDMDIHFFSDTELASAKSPSRPSTPIQSDSELEISHRDKTESTDLMSGSASWKWGELPTQSNEPITEDAKQAQRNSMINNIFSFMKQSKKLQKNSMEGVYLSDLDTQGMDPEVAAMYFPSLTKTDVAQQIAFAGNDDDRESGNGTSLPHSPSSMEGLKSIDSDYEDGVKVGDKPLDFVSMSLCGGLESGTGPSDDDFERHIVPYAEVCENPSIFASPLLVVRLSGKYYSWAAACPIIMTIIIYQKPLSNNAIEQLMNVNKPPAEGSGSQSVAETKRGGYSWWWRRSGGEAAPGSGVGGGGGADKPLKDKDSDGGSGGKEGDINAVATQTSRAGTPIDAAATPKALVVPATPTDENSKLNVTGNSDASELNKSLDLAEEAHGEMYRKSLRLTSEQIECLNLKNGMNEISFSVTTAYQGTSRCKCYLFRWKHNDKVVISDIDGTITKSDVLGHILPMVGRDWAQIGVAQLFSKIEENGYKLLYLSARAIGQSKATREYLRSIRQGDVKLPDGPLLLNPTSLISALHREVIEKKPEEFKIACLSDIQALFPENPFYAGYGNRINDVWAYRAVGIPIMRIFTINPKGELKHELTQTFQSSYCNMTNIVDQLFPPINTIEESAEFSNFNYWREPVAEMDPVSMELAEVVANVGGGGGGSNQQTPTAQSKQLPTIPENQKV